MPATRRICYIFSRVSGILGWEGRNHLKPRWLERLDRLTRLSAMKPKWWWNNSKTDSYQAVSPNIAAIPILWWGLSYFIKKITWSSIFSQQKNCPTLPQTQMTPPIYQKKLSVNFMSQRLVFVSLKGLGPVAPSHSTSVASHGVVSTRKLHNWPCPPNGGPPLGQLFKRWKVDSEYQTLRVPPNDSLPM